MIVNYQPNPLNTFDLRELEHCPPHFSVVDFSISCHEKKLRDWIWSNLIGRFYLGDHYVNISNGNKSVTVLQKRAAFEIAGEASYFALFLPEINKF